MTIHSSTSMTPPFFTDLGKSQKLPDLCKQRWPTPRIQGKPGRGYRFHVACGKAGQSKVRHRALPSPPPRLPRNEGEAVWLDSSCPSPLRPINRNHRLFSRSCKSNRRETWRRPGATQHTGGVERSKPPGGQKQRPSGYQSTSPRSYENFPLRLLYRAIRSLTASARRGPAQLP